MTFQSTSKIHFVCLCRIMALHSGIKNTLEITAYNSLETQYSKWDWKFRSAMLDWEQKAENDINTEPLESLENKVQLKLRELQIFVSKNLYDRLKSEMDVFFNGVVLVQWKGKFEQQLSQLAEEGKHHAEEHCRKLFEIRKKIAEFEKATNRDAIKNKDLEKHVKGPLDIAGTICAYLKTPIRVQVERKLGPKMVDSMRASEHYFVNKTALKVKILKDLYEKNDFQEYMAYLRNVRQSLEDHIEKYTVMYCDQKLPNGKLTRLQNSAREEVYQLIQVIENAVSQVNNTDIQTWMTDFCRNESIRRELEIQLDPMELLNDYDTLQELNIDNFKQRIKEELQELKQTFEELFSKITYKSIDWRYKPHELLNSLVGCTAQCPFCGEQCDLLQEQHDSQCDHRAEVHRMDCLAGFREKDTRVMTTNVCPALVDGRGSFRKPDGESHPYREYKTVCRTWSIPPDVTSKSCSYWKWFVGTYKDQLAKEYDALPAKAPPQWSQIKWLEIKEDLESAYNVEI